MSEYSCLSDGCDEEILGANGLQGSGIWCRGHVLKHYGVDSIESAAKIERGATYRGYGEDHGDNVRENYAEWIR